MSIEDALGRPPAPYDTIGNLEREYVRGVFEKGASILNRARVPRFFQELVRKIGKDYSDVEVKEATLTSDGMVVTSVDWDFRILENAPAEHGRPLEYSSIRVLARPLTDDLIVAGGMFEGLYKGSPDVGSRGLEDALVRAYRYPATARKA